jgi:hypothetical protein
MLKEEKKRNLKTFLNPKSKGVSNMKPFRIAVVLMALLVLLLFVGQVFAAVSYTRLDTLYVPWGKISKNTNDRALLGFRIDGVGSGKSLKSIVVKSFIQKAYSIEKLKLYMEDNDSVGLQVGIGGDKLVKTLDVYSRRFDSNERGRFTGLTQALNASPDSNLFYLAIDAHTDTVGAYPDIFNGQCLELIIEPDSLKLNDNSSNPDTIYNKRYGTIDDDSTGFCPDDPYNHGYPGCRYRLCFDTYGPRFDLHFCIAANTCSTEAYYPMEPYIRVPMVDQEDSIRICATNIESDIDTSEGIHIIGKVELLGYVGSLHMFGVDDIVLKWDDNQIEAGDSCNNHCDDDYNTLFQIPDARNVGGFDGVDADTGHWYVCGWAKDSAGNVDTICLGHEDLVYRIDTQKPIIDSISWQLVNDLNGDGKIGLGDCIMIIGWGYSNPILPLKELVQMRVDTSWMAGHSPAYPNGEWAVLSDTTQENNRIFRRVFCITTPLDIDSSGGCPVNFLVEAWDNACNYDTSRGEICADMDLEPPSVDVTYEWESDYDTMWACMGLGDQVRIRADVGGDDIVSVTAMMDSMGIDALMRHALPLPHRGGTIYDTLWTITEPPIQYGKDRDNTQPPARDSLYRAWVTACDDAGNCVTGYADLNKVLDTRRPRPIGYFCPDSVPCALVATPLPGAKIMLQWDTACDENDAFYYYVWASFNGAPFESIGNTNVTEQTIGSKYYSWHSEPLEAGWWTFKIKTEDNCSNIGDFSCEVGTIADSTPPNACLVFPDSGGIYGDPFAVKARSEDQDIQSVCLWYRLRNDLNDPPTGEIGQWTPCLSKPCMYRPDNGLVFLDTVECIHDYVGWVELLPLSCDVIGNCQDTTRAYNEACIDDSLQNLIPGHFLFYWDTTRCVARVVSVNDTISPQTLCGYNVNPDIMNQVIINVDGATPADSFTIDVKALNKYKSSYRIDYRNNVTMPCTIMVSVDNWDAGTQYLYVKVTNQGNGKECVPCPMAIPLCVPPQTAPCITIVSPLEWMRIPCSKTDKTCVPIWAEITPGCPESLVTQVKFFYSKNTPGPPWNLIEEVIQPDTEWVLGHPVLYWKTCWNNYGLVQDGDTVYFMAEGFNQYHIGGASKMVKVFVDCTAPTVKLKIEDVITTCFGIPKVAGDIILKAEILDTLVDVTDVDFWYKLDSDPDIPAYWHKLTEGQRGWWWDSGDELQPWSENIWAGDYDTEDLPNQTWIDIRVSVKDQAGNVWLDSDEDGQFDDSTFMVAVAADAGIRVFVDNQAPAPAISMVADTLAKIYNVNPSTLLGGLGEAYVKAGDDINSQISVLPSEDTCEVMKVEWFLCMPIDDFMVRAPEQSPAQSSKFIPHLDIHQGDNCQNPIELTLPRDLDFDDTNHTCGRGNDYQGTCLAPFDSSEDIIYKLNVTTNVILQIKWRTFNMWKSGVALFEGCPGHGGPASSGPDLVGGYGGGCLYHSHGISPNEWHHLKGYGNCRHLYLEPGTYYLMLDSKRGCRDAELSPSASGQSPSDLEEGNFELEITGEAIGCQHVGTSNDPYHFPVNFNPVEDGLIPAYELEDHFWHGSIQAVLYDSLGNYKTDDVGLYILDVTASQAVIVNPLNDSYVSGDVLLQSKSLNDYEICKVCYEYKPEGDSVWYPVNEGYPNACDTHGQGWSLTWHTLHTIPDGAYYLRAVATDCSNNVDTLPPTIKVTVSNGVPTVVLDDPRICERTCPDDTVDTLGYVSGTVPLYATVTSTIPVDYVKFYCKNIFSYPDDWTYIGSDDYPTNGKYSVEWSTPSDGRYHVKAVAATYSGKEGESEWMVISVDNSGPDTKIISIMGEDHLGSGVDISKGTVVPIEIVAQDWTSPEGWTRCYNSGLTKISVCIAMCDSNYNPKDTTEITKCFEVDSVYDGTHTVLWNTSGLEYEGCEGCYYIYVKAQDCLGNETISDSVKVYVRDITAPVTTIGGFNRYYDDERKDYLYSILGYSDEKVKTLLFEYADSGSTNWTPIGWSSYIEAPCCDYYLYMTTWNPTSLKNGLYQIRVISHDTCSNQADSLAPWAYIDVENGIITPYNPGVLGNLSFEKNWCVGGMHGIVRQTCSSGTPMVLAYYGGDYGECVEMQSDLQKTTDYAGSFNADYITDGGSAKFFSSVTVKTGDEYMTGEPTYVTYLTQGSFDVVQVKRDLGTHGTYQEGCVDVTIPAGAVGGTSTYDRYIWVSPTMMPWAPVTQPDIKPIGDNNGYATYVSFTDCYYCCGYWKSHYGWAQGEVPKSPSSEGYGDCCFNTGRWAKIKMCYDSTVTTDKAHLAVMWWDCEDGEFKSDNIFYPAAVEGFNTTNHTVEFATTCLSGPFAVVELLERPCDGSIVVNMRAQDIEPYCDGYTSPTPKFTSLITDNVEGPSGIDRHSIQFKVDLFESGQLVRIYDAGHYDDCHKWTPGFGSFEGSGYDKVSGIFRAGWNDSTYHHSQGDNDEWASCDQCYQEYFGSDYLTYCIPMFPLAGGEHMAVVTAMNDHIQTCTDTVQFTVDATKPMVLFDTTQHYVGREPMFNVYMWDNESGVDRSSIYMDLFGSNYSSSSPSYHDYITTIRPDQLAGMWVNDTTLRVDLRSLNMNAGGGYLHIYIYDGNKCGQSCPGTYYQYYYGGVSDCVGNKRTTDWYYYTVDMYGPTITNAYTTICDAKLKFQITDALSGVDPSRVYVYEDNTAMPLLIEQDPHNPDYWYYTPSAGPHHVDIRAYDKLGNFTVKSFDLTGDCMPPVVSFIPGYISCLTPTVKIVVSDAGTGVMWDSVKVDLYYYSNLLETYDAFGPNQWTRSGDTITVVGDGARLGIYDGYNLYAVVYHEKTGVTSYSKGPKDLAGNWTPTQWIQQSYTADCYGPSITWKNSSTPCDRPIKLQITDAKSGVATVMLYQDNVDMTSSLAYDTSSGLWLYTPSAGKHTMDVIATDVVGNKTTYTFDVKDDCEGPAVSFSTGWVPKNPTIRFTVSDPSGVDWNTVNARVSGCGKECVYLAPELKKHADMETGEVTLEDCVLGCSDGGVVDVWVYSGTSYTGSGPADLIGNYAPSYYRCSFEVDAAAPVLSIASKSKTDQGLTYITEPPVKIKITESSSGIDWTTLSVMQDSLEFPAESLMIDETNGLVEFFPAPMRHQIVMSIKDKVGNLSSPLIFWTEAGELYFTSEQGAHNYPNPFDPRKTTTCIALGLSKSAYVTAKLYDFAGEFVRTLTQDAMVSPAACIRWDGKTEDGTEVSNGTYLCHIKARDPETSKIQTAVIKITVLKEDK